MVVLHSVEWGGGYSEIPMCMSSYSDRIVQIFESS